MSFFIKNIHDFFCIRKLRRQLKVLDCTLCFKEEIKIRMFIGLRVKTLDDIPDNKREVFLKKKQLRQELRFISGYNKENSYVYNE